MIYTARPVRYVSRAAPTPSTTKVLFFFYSFFLLITVVLLNLHLMWMGIVEIKIKFLVRTLDLDVIMKTKLPVDVNFIS